MSLNGKTNQAKKFGNSGGLLRSSAFENDVFLELSHSQGCDTLGRVTRQRFCRDRHRFWALKYPGCEDPRFFVKNRRLLEFGAGFRE